MTAEEKLFAMSNSMISGLHNALIFWLRDFESKNCRPMTLDEAKSLVNRMASNSGAELNDEAVEIWCYETAENNPDLIQC